MNKPIRCTTHFHACDCREYEFQLINDENENLKVWIKHHQASAQNAINEKSELQKKLDDKRVYIKQLKDNNLSLTELIEPMSRKIDEKDAEIEGLENKLKNEEDCWLISMESRDEKIADLQKENERLQKENQEMREALKWALSTLPHSSIDKNDYTKVINLQNKFNLSETPNSSKEGVNCSHCSGNHLNFDCPTMANE